VLLVLVSNLIACGKEDSVEGIETATAMPVNVTSTPVVEEVEVQLFQEWHVQAGEVTLYALVSGDSSSGNVLIAIHGGPGMSSDYMQDLEQLAGPDLAVITYDQRGTGLSTAPPASATSYEFIDYVNDLEAVRAAAGVEKVHLLGHSWGGVLAMRYATEHPERVHSLVLTGSGPPDWTTIFEGNIHFQERIRALQQQGIIPEVLPTDSAAMLQAILPAYFSDPKFTFSTDEDAPPQYSQIANELTWSAIGEYDFRSEVAELNHPILLLWGEDDPFGLQMAESTRDALQSAQIEYLILDQCGHFWHECSERFFPEVRSFLEKTLDGVEIGN
jgi:proline iminopeptidase